jgi:hypothetical protein
MEIAEYQILLRKSFRELLIRAFVYLYEDVLRLSILTQYCGFNDGGKGPLGIGEGNYLRLAVGRVVPQFLTEGLKHRKQGVHQLVSLPWPRLNRLA